MTTKRILSALVLTVGAAAAFADADVVSVRKANYVEDQMEQGRRAIESIDPLDTRASQLQDIRTAVRHFRLARAESVRDIPRSTAFTDMIAEANVRLADALVKEARIYFDRGSLPLARKRVDEALVLAPNDRDAGYLAAVLDVSGSDPYHTIAGRRIGHRLERIDRLDFVR